MPPHPPPPPPPPPQPQEITQPSFLPTYHHFPTNISQASMLSPHFRREGSCTTLAPPLSLLWYKWKGWFWQSFKKRFYIMRHSVLSLWEKEVKKIRKIGESKTCKTAVTATHPSSEPISSFLPPCCCNYVRRRETCQSEIKEEEGLDGKLGRVGRGWIQIRGKYVGKYGLELVWLVQRYRRKSLFLLLLLLPNFEFRSGRKRRKSWEDEWKVFFYFFSHSIGGEMCWLSLVKKLRFEFSLQHYIFSAINCA